MRINAPTFGYVLSNEWDGEPPAWGIGKSPLWAMAATSPALILQTVETENSQNRRPNEVGRFGNMHMNHSRPNESTREFDGFVINHPILAMLVLGLIALIGFGCIFALPIGWLPF